MADKQYTIRIGSDNVLELSGVKDAVTDAYIDSGSGAGVLKDSDGTTVTGAGALTLTHVDGSTTGEWYVTSIVVREVDGEYESTTTSRRVALTPDIVCELRLEAE